MNNVVISTSNLCDLYLSYIWYNDDNLL